VQRQGESTGSPGPGQREPANALRHGLDVIQPRGLGRGPVIPSYAGDGAGGGRERGTGGVE